MIRPGPLLLLFMIGVYFGIGMLLHSILVSPTVVWSSALSLGIILGWGPVAVISGIVILFFLMCIFDR